MKNIPSAYLVYHKCKSKKCANYPVYNQILGQYYFPGDEELCLGCKSYYEVVVKGWSLYIGKDGSVDIRKEEI